MYCLDHFLAWNSQIHLSSLRGLSVESDSVNARERGAFQRGRGRGVRGTAMNSGRFDTRFGPERGGPATRSRGGSRGRGDRTERPERTEREGGKSAQIRYSLNVESHRTCYLLFIYRQLSV